MEDKMTKINKILLAILVLLGAILIGSDKERLSYIYDNVVLETLFDNGEVEPVE
jgi:hypothetical protein